MKKESGLHIAVCKYISMQYPTAIFNTDLSGIRLTMGQAMAVKRMRSSNSFPDIVIYHNNQIYYALFIELKHREAKLLRKDGCLCSDPHLREQNEMLHALEEQGYCARFGWGFDKTKSLIDWYMTMDPRIYKKPPIPPYYEFDKTKGQTTLPLDESRR